MVMLTAIFLNANPNWGLGEDENVNIDKFKDWMQEMLKQWQHLKTLKMKILDLENV